MIYFIKQYWKYFAMALAFASASYLLNYLNVNADTYTSNTNLFENSYTNNLLDMANSQVENFTNKYYVIIQYDYNYYLIVSDKYELSNNRITMNNTNIIQATRNSSGYSYTYEYTTTTENSTIINVNNIIVSNISTSKSITGKRFEEYKQNNIVKNIGVFLLGLVFAIFLTKERVYL